MLANIQNEDECVQETLIELFLYVSLRQDSSLRIFKFKCNHDLFETPV